MIATMYSRPAEVNTESRYEKKDYRINEILLNKLGFVKEDSPPGRDNCIFRYHNPSKKGIGFDLIFIEEFSILSVEEFQIDTESGKTYFRNTIVGIFSIESDEDLKFIFSRNVRLNYVFKISLKKINCAA